MLQVHWYSIALRCIMSPWRNLGLRSRHQSSVAKATMGNHLYAFRDKGRSRSVRRLSMARLASPGLVRNGLPGEPWEPPAASKDGVSFGSSICCASRLRRFSFAPRARVSKWLSACRAQRASAGLSCIRDMLKRRNGFLRHRARTASALRWASFSRRRVTVRRRTDASSCLHTTSVQRAALHRRCSGP